MPPSATQNFVAPQTTEDVPVPATFTQKGYYFTLPANRLHYPGAPSGSQLRVLRVGNDTHCSPRKQGCNPPLPDSGPYRYEAEMGAPVCAHLGPWAGPPLFLD